MAVTKEDLLRAQQLAQQGVLKAPDSFKLASLEDLKKYVNGCGSAGSWFRPPSTIYGVSILAACIIHDWEYTFGVDKADKKKADTNFKDNMSILLERGDTIVTPLTLMMVRATVYYKAVSLFGRDAFFSGKQKVKKVLKIK